jgi:hypothetical protein
MKQLIVLIAAFAVISGALAQDSAEKKMDHDKMNKMEMNHKIKNSVMMKDGKMMMMKDGKMMVMEKEMTMNNGTKVMTDGKVMMKDGTTKMMEDGDCIYMDGKMGKMDKMKMPEKKDGGN